MIRYGVPQRARQSGRLTRPSTQAAAHGLCRKVFARGRNSQAFHILEEGSCWLKLDEEPAPRLLGPGDIVVLPQRQGHQLSDDPASPIRVEIAVRRLADALFIQLVRVWLESQPAASRGWLGALGDPVVGAALGQLHRDPAQPWTVATLAQEVGLSRSAFAARFTQLVGEPPLHYLTRWRMHLAVALLRDETLGIKEVALRTGYGSEAAFSIAFKRHFGLAPGAYRQTNRA